MSEDHTPGTWLLIALTLTATFLFVLYLNGVPQ
jgi:hypothetical protein